MDAPKHTPVPVVCHEMQAAPVSVRLDDIHLRATFRLFSKLNVANPITKRLVPLELVTTLQLLKTNLMEVIRNLESYGHDWAAPLCTVNGRDTSYAVSDASAKLLLGSCTNTIRGQSKGSWNQWLAQPRQMTGNLFYSFMNQRSTFGPRPDTTIIWAQPVRFAAQVFAWRSGHSHSDSFNAANDRVRLTCSCGETISEAAHVLLRCRAYTQQRQVLGAELLHMPITSEAELKVVIKQLIYTAEGLERVFKFLRLIDAIE